MNKLSTEERMRVVAALLEGNSLRAVARMTSVHRTTIMKLLVDLGAACSEYKEKAFRNLSCKRIHWDEIWNFVGAKELKEAIAAIPDDPMCVSAQRSGITLDH